MNILRHKSWHVRTKENVARVLKDQRKAAEEKKREEERALQAEREHRMRLLRQRADEKKTAAIGFDTREPVIQKLDEEVVFDPQGQVTSRNDAEIIGEDGHINFFIDIEREEKTTGHNIEREKEKKDEQEDWEKKIGLLKYLGEGSAEYDKGKDQPWWMSAKPRDNIERIKNYKQRAKGEHPRSEIPEFMRRLSNKSANAIVSNPLESRTVPNTQAILFPSDLDGTAAELKARKKARKEAKKAKKDKKERKKKKRKHSSDEETGAVGTRQISDDALQRLRTERLIREAEERSKAEAAIRKAKGIKEPTPPQDPVEKRRKYNSQFNPELARQNDGRDREDRYHRRY